ncbi:MAG: hypothetical protein M3478_08075 [Planctomycetota bacterium]|nr:hypothetical protein [Planctomycetota bacterium]
MDMSKLPRLSQTNKDDAPAPVPGGTPAPPTPDPNRPVPDFQPRDSGAYDRDRDRGGYDPGYSVGAEVWISVILGIVFMFMGFNFARYAAAKLTGETYHTNVNWTVGEKAGHEVAYYELQGGTAHTESGLFLFGLALVLEALGLLIAHTGAPGKRFFVGFALFVTLLATGYNLFVVAKLFGMGITPLMSVIAVAIGGYMATYQLRLWKQVSATTRSHA